MGMKTKVNFEKSVLCTIAIPKETMDEHSLDILINGIMTGILRDVPSKDFDRDKMEEVLTDMLQTNLEHGYTRTVNGSMMMRGSLEGDEYLFELTKYTPKLELVEEDDK